MAPLFWWKPTNNRGSYDPGDVAVIHPEIPSQDVNSFLSTMGWLDIADSVYTIIVSFRGKLRTILFVLLVDNISDQTLPDHLPPSATLRTIFTRYLNINAVPRYGFFEILHHFARNPLEKEKLQEFITPEGAVCCTVPQVNWIQIIYFVAGRSLRVRADGAQNDQRGSGRVPLCTDTPRLHLRRFPPAATPRILDSKFCEGAHSQLVPVCSTTEGNARATRKKFIFALQW